MHSKAYGLSFRYTPLECPTEQLIVLMFDEVRSGLVIFALMTRSERSNSPEELGKIDNFDKVLLSYHIRGRSAPSDSVIPREGQK